ncbi:hypothetical protein B0H19DRAFT_1083603 [Mycena capillaripes]|nr:hypothetical protein B0H19DRAFT_1083603 [Mycena capillaripes]
MADEYPRKAGRALLPVYISLLLQAHRTCPTGSRRHTVICLPTRELHPSESSVFNPTSFHHNHFSHLGYQDHKHSQFGALRGINEDSGSEKREIFSYHVVAGQLKHKDSMGNTEILKRSDLHLTSAGTGIPSITDKKKEFGSTDEDEVVVGAQSKEGPTSS